MAYTGMNKADWESREYLLDAQSANNALGTVLNTSHQMYGAIKNSQTKKINAELDTRFSEVENEIQMDKSIPPQERGNVLKERYQAIIAEAKEAHKTLPGVFKDIEDSLDLRRNSKLNDWSAMDLREYENARLEFGFSQLDQLVSSTDARDVLKASGTIKEKDYQLPQAEQSQKEGSEGFIGFSSDFEIRKHDSEPQSSVFDAELHQAAHSDMSEWDFRVLAITKMAKELYPNSELKQNVVIHDYTEKLRGELPYQDLDLLFTATFRDDNMDEWDYSGARAQYRNQLQNETYGGKPLTKPMQDSLLKQFDSKYEDLVSGLYKQAADIFEQSIMQPIAELKMAHIQDGNKPFLPEHVEEIYNPVIKESGIPEKFFRELKESDMLIARNNEKIKMQNDFKRLYKLGEKRSAEESGQMFELSKMFTLEQIESLKLQAMDSARNLNNIAMVETSGVAMLSDIEVYNNLDYKIAGGGFKSQKEFDEAIKSAKENGSLSEDAAATLENSYSRFNANKKQYENEAILDANKKLGALAYSKNLKTTDVMAIGEQLGLSPEENPEFYEIWTERAKSDAVRNATELINIMDFKDEMTVSQVKLAAEMYEIGTATAEYKTWMNKAEQNWENHLAKLSKTKQGFAEKSSKDAVSGVSEQIGLYREGKITKADALKALEAKKDVLSYEDYHRAYNDIGNADMKERERQTQVFTEEVLRPFLESRDSIMPGESEKRLRNAGLDPLNFHSELAEMRDTEALNQHRKHIPEYMKLQSYLKMREIGITDADIEKLGFEVPDTSFTNTLAYREMHGGEMFLSPKDLATKQLELIKNKMIEDTLPSGKAFQGTLSTKGLDKTIDDSVKEVHKRIEKAGEYGGRVDNSETISLLNMERYNLDDNQYHTLLWQKLLAGEITQKTYNERVAEDISVYKGPEYEATQKALKDFERYMKDAAKSGTDSKGKPVYVSEIALDLAVKNAKAVFLDEYNRAKANANGAPVIVDDIVKRTYDMVVNNKYQNMAEEVLSSMKKDTTQMYGGLFGTKGTTSYEILESFQKGEAFLVDKEALARLLSDPSSGSTSLGSEEGTFGTWDAMRRNGMSDTKVSRQIILDTARFLGLSTEDGLPLDIDSGSFDKDMKSFIETLPEVSKGQLMQTATIAKWTLDVKRFAEKSLSPELVKALDPESKIEPFVSESNNLGVVVGETPFIFIEGGRRSETMLAYIGQNGQLVTFEATTQKVEGATKSFEKSLSDSLYGMNFHGYPIDNRDSNGDLLPINIEGLCEHMGESIKYATESRAFKNKKNEFLSLINQEIKEYNALSGASKPFYEDLRIYVDLDAMLEANESGSLVDTDLMSFVKYRFIESNI